MTAYYNEIDPFAAAWLRELIAAGHIASGVVDERSIEDVRPDELLGYTQCHFFAGIGVWSYALRYAGWPDDRPVWTGSCPCQPFSSAGQGTGFADERHLWPAFHHLIRVCRPAAVFGEQVASKDAGPWIDLVHADLEALGYAFGCVPFPSAGVGAPHIRDRAYWVAHANEGRRGWRALDGASLGDGQATGWIKDASYLARSGAVRGLADAADERLHGRRASGPCDGRDTARIESERLCDAGIDYRPGPTNGLWRDADWLLCRDGKWRPVEPGTFPLAHGSAARVGRLRGYGNAINAEAARVFIEEVMEVA